MAEGARGGRTPRPVRRLGRRGSRSRAPSRWGSGGRSPAGRPSCPGTDGHGLRDRTRVEQPRRLELGGEAHQVVHGGDAVLRGRALQRRRRSCPSGSSTAWRRYSANGISVAFAMWSPSTSNPALEYSRRVPGGAVTRCSSKARPEVCASRWRTVEPGGPAGSSSSMAPSSYATSAAYAASGLVTEASGKRCADGAVGAEDRAVRPYDGRRGGGNGPVLDQRQALQREDMASSLSGSRAAAASRGPVGNGCWACRPVLVTSGRAEGCGRQRMIESTIIFCPSCAGEIVVRRSLSCASRGVWVGVSLSRVGD